MLTSVPQFADGPRVMCGPTAISSVTGVHPHEVIRVVNQLRGVNSPIRGMCDFEVCNVIGYLGYSTRVLETMPLRGYKRVTLRMYLEERTEGPPTIFSVTKHFLVSDGIDALCNQTNGEPVPSPVHPYYLATLKRIIYVTRRIS